MRSISWYVSTITDCATDFSPCEYTVDEPFYHGATENMETNVGKDHPQYSIDLHNLAGLLENQMGTNLSFFIPVRSLLGYMCFNRSVSFRLLYDKSPTQEFSFPLRNPCLSEWIRCQIASYVGVN